MIFPVIFPITNISYENTKKQPIYLQQSGKMQKSQWKVVKH